MRVSMLLSGMALALSSVLGGCVTGQDKPPQQAAANRPFNITSYQLLAPTEKAEARNWTEEQIRQHISGTTFLRHTPGRGNQVLYFSPQNVMYGWAGKEKHIETATWSIALRTPVGREKAQLFVCMPLSGFDKDGNAIAGQVINLCLEPAMLYIPAVDHASGDVFGLQTRKIPPFELPLERTTISALMH